MLKAGEYPRRSALRAERSHVLAASRTCQSARPKESARAVLACGMLVRVPYNEASTSKADTKLQ